MDSSSMPTRMLVVANRVAATPRRSALAAASVLDDAEYDDGGRAMAQEQHDGGRLARRRARRRAEQAKERERTGDSPERLRERANEVPPKVDQPSAVVKALERVVALSGGGGGGG
jgi:hypothetical protein